MKNLLIVESENDKYFIEALIKHINIDNVEVSNGFLCGIDDFECLDGLSSAKLTTTLKAIKIKVKKDEIDKIGILIDIDDKTVEERLALINTSIKDCFNTENAIQAINKFSTIPIDAHQNMEIAAYFTNINGKGELETVLKTIKNKPSFILFV